VVRLVTPRARLAPGLRRAYFLAIAPAALLAPVPLAWTGGASRVGILFFEVALLFLWWRAASGRPVGLSDTVLNVAGMLYLIWLGFETVTLRLGLLHSVSHLLLFTAIAKLASLKRPSEARLALLVVFLLTLAAASSSTHVASLVYFAAMAWIGFRTLGRLAVLADFDEAPPERVLRSVPTGGLTAVALAGGALLTAPLFFALPRLHTPFAAAPFRIDDAFSRALSPDRVDLESFSAAKRSDRVILRLTAAPVSPRGEALRLREAVFTEYQDGVWLRDPRVGARRGEHSAFAGRGAADGRPPDSVVTVDLNVFGRGFLFLPYETSAVRVTRGHALEMPDGVMQTSSGRGPVRYQADVRHGAVRGPGRGAISLADVPPEIQRYAEALTGDLSEPGAIYRRILEHLRKDFVYTLDPPRPRGDPLVYFLLRSKAGHCEYFASAAAMMLAARGVPARLVTGSFGGENGLFSDAIVVRADNLHAWVEANLDGTGFQPLDPTPPAGVPPALRPFSVFSRLAALGREIEFFYDRRILGFDAADQVDAVDSVRDSLASVGERLSSLSRSAKEVLSSGAVAGALGLVLAAWLAARLLGTRRAGRSAERRAYLLLRRLLSRRGGMVTPSTPPAEVARRFAEVLPEGGPDAEAVVAAYCASAFGGVEPGPETARELSARLRRLRRLA
jgi:hypothetical protein